MHCKYHSLQRKPGHGLTTLVVGGAQEALQGDDTTIELTLKNRKGFVKLALETGVDLVPSFGFGEQHIFRMINSPEGSKMRRFQEWVKRKLTFSPVIFTGRGIFQYLYVIKHYLCHRKLLFSIEFIFDSYGLLPYRRPINVVVGQPIEVTQVKNPSQEDIDELHAKYIVALKKLYDEHNPIHGDVSISLII